MTTQNSQPLYGLKWKRYESELRYSGYKILQSIRLKKLKKAIIEQFGDEMDFITKTTTLSIFDFMAFLNITMLLT